MPRLQLPKTINFSAVAGLPAPISSTELKVTSFIIQNRLSNSDFILVGDLTGQSFQIAPGKDLAVNGDNLDNGTTAFMNLQDWYVDALSGTQVVDILYLERY